MFTTPFESQMNYFGCLKLVKLPTVWAFACFDCLKNCLHYGHLSASCLLLWLRNKNNTKNVFPTTLVSGLVAKSLFFVVVVVAVVVIVVVVVSGFVVLDLIQINPD